MKGSGSGLIKLLHRYLPGEPEKNHEYIRIADDPVEIRNRRVPNTDLKFPEIRNIITVTPFYF